MSFYRAERKPFAQSFVRKGAIGDTFVRKVARGSHLYGRAIEGTHMYGRGLPEGTYFFVVISASTRTRLSP
jgi:hypothetical protein